MDLWVSFIIEYDMAGNQRAKCTQCPAAKHLPERITRDEVAMHNSALEWAREHSETVGHTATVEV